MAISIEFADDAALHARIKVVGVGGSGGNALNTMVASGLDAGTKVVTGQPTDTPAGSDFRQI